MGSDGDAALEARGIVKRYGDLVAVDGLDVRVARGTCLGLLGPNGAGKSTTIRILLGLLKADSGRVELLGGDPWRDVVELHRRLAYVPGDVALWPAMTGGQAIDLLGTLRGGLDETRRAELIERFDLDPSKRGRQYSKGNRQKVAVIAALASRVELLILDEPTSGLDPLMEAVFQQEIRRERENGRSILLSSHILSEAEALADRISIIRDGRVVEVGTIDELRAHTASTITATLTRLPDSLSALDFVHEPRLDGHVFSARVDRDHLTRALELLTPFGFTDLTVAPPSLESLFLEKYEARP